MLKIYFDNCCYCRPFDDLRQSAVNNESNAKLFAQSLVKDKVIKLCYSYMSIAEILDSSIEYNKTSILGFINEVGGDYVGYDESAVVPLAKDAISTGVKEKDANHVACAIIGGCDYFLTTDKRLLKYAPKEIAIVNPIEFIKIWEETNNV